MKKRSPLIIGGFALLAITAVVAIIFIFRYSGKPRVKNIRPHLLVEGKDSVLRIYGRNFPDSARIEVNFSGVPAVIRSVHDDSIIAIADIPRLREGKTGDVFRTNMAVRVDQKVIHLETVSIKMDNEVVVSSLSPKSIKTGYTLTVNGKNLTNSHLIKVFIGKPGFQLHEASIVSTSKNVLKAKVPDIPEVPDNVTAAVTIRVHAGGKQIYSGHATLNPKFQGPVFEIPNNINKAVLKKYQ